jgi:hypothetical protein
MADSAVSARTTTTPESRRVPILAIILAISIAANLALIGVLVLGRSAATPKAVAAESFNDKAWYGVFINNNEAFVGHITAADSQNITMRSIYYLTLEARDAAGKPIANPQADQFKPFIKKLGQEVYGPKDVIQINRQNVRYYSELRDDSDVVKAIVVFEKTASPAPGG